MGKSATLAGAVERFVAPIDQLELACRMIEAAGRVKRPKGASAAEAFFAMDKEDQDRWLAAATAAMGYWRECIEVAQRPN